MAFKNQQPATVTLTLDEFERLKQGYNVFEDDLTFIEYTSYTGWSNSFRLQTNDEVTAQLGEDYKRALEKIEELEKRLNEKPVKPKGFIAKVKFLFS